MQVSGRLLATTEAVIFVRYSAFGIVSIVYAATVSSKYNAGDMFGAMEASKKARTWMIASIVVGLVAVVLWIVLVAMTSSSSTTNQYNYP